MAPPASWTRSAIELADQRPDRDRRDEVTVHHVDVDHPRAGRHHLLDLRAEPREVSGENRRGDPLAREELAATRRGGIRGGFQGQIELSIEWPQLLALHVLGATHPADRPVLAAVGALGYQLEAAQAVDADEPARELRGTQPGLAAARAIRALQGALRRLRSRVASQTAVDSFRHVTRVSSATEPFAGDGARAGNRPRSSASFPGG